VGDRWTWEVSRHVGAGLRLLFIPTEPATTDVIATWDLTIDRSLGGGRHAATLARTVGGGLPARTDLVLWLQGAELWMDSPQGARVALELAVPPEAVAVEKVPCTAWFLDGLTGTCSPAPGGPLAVPPGPTFLVVSSSGNSGASLTQVLVGIGTAGMIIPGDRSASEYANLLGWTTKAPAPASPRIERWRKDPTPAALPGLLAGVGREDAAAMVVLTRGDDIAAVTTSLLDALTPLDRVPVLRVALHAEGDAAQRLALLAVLVSHLGATPNTARMNSILTLFAEEQQPAVRGLVTGEWQMLRAVLLAEDPAEGLRSMGPYTPSPEESNAVLARFDEPGVVLADVLARTPPERQFVVFTAVCERATFDDDRLVLVQASPAMVTRAAASTEDTRALLETFNFDDDRVSTVKLIAAAAPQDKRGKIVRVGIEAMDFDSARLALIDALPIEARAMSPADRKAALASFVFEREAAEAKLR
jgi:hypothetical protein